MLNEKYRIYTTLDGSGNRTFHAGEMKSKLPVFMERQWTFCGSSYKRMYNIPELLKMITGVNARCSDEDDDIDHLGRAINKAKYSTKETSKIFVDVVGISPIKYIKIWNGVTYKEMYEPLKAEYDKYCFFQGRLNNHRMHSYLRNKEYVQGAEKFHKGTLAPFAVFCGEKWVDFDYLKDNSFSRNKLISDAVGWGWSDIKHLSTLPSSLIRLNMSSEYNLVAVVAKRLGIPYNRMDNHNVSSAFGSLIRSAKIYDAYDTVLVLLQRLECEDVKNFPRIVESFCFESGCDFGLQEWFSKEHLAPYFHQKRSKKDLEASKQLARKQTCHRYMEKKLGGFQTEEDTCLKGSIGFGGEIF